jgi:alpha-1,3-rhamnosyltransferase
MSDDLITIIVASYNHERFIQEALNALINQTYKNLELILIDDGSTDSTYEKVLEMKPQLERRFVNLYIEKQENIGCPLTVKKLVNLAKGKYIFSIASDDVANPDAIEVLHNFFLKNDDYICVVGDNEFIDNDSKPVLMDIEKRIVGEESHHAFKTFLEYAYIRFQKLYGKRLFGRNKLEDYDYIPYELLWYDHLIPIGLLIKTDIMKKVTDFNVNTPVDDVYIHYQITKLGKEKVLNVPLVKYRLHSKQTINNSNHLDAARCTRFYELYLLDTKYPEFKIADIENSWWYLDHKVEWENSKNSPYWDEKYYVNKYPEVMEQGWVPLIHYLYIGKDLGYLPSRYYESIFHRVHKGRNMLCEKKLVTKLKRRLKIIYYLLVLILSQLPLIDCIISAKYRLKCMRGVKKYWR